MVVNAPQSNIVSAAELAVGLLLAAARNIAPANAALKQGEWKRSKYTGVELYEKTAGIVGLGRIGALVAQRLSAFGMNVIAYDPFVAAGRAAQMGVRLVSLDELLRTSDVISVHLPKTAETVGHHRRRAARHGQAVADPGQRRARRHRRRGTRCYSALKEGRVAAAGLDVYAKRAVHRLAAVRAGERRRHAAPRRQHRRGAGEGRRLGREVGAPRAGRRARAGRGQRAGRRHRRGRPPGHPAGRAPRPVLHGGRRRRTRAAGHRGARRDRRARRAGARARGPQGAVHRRRRGAGVLRQRAGARRRPRRAGPPHAPTPSRPTTATWSPCAARSPTAPQVSVAGTLTGTAARREDRRDRRLRRRGRAVRPHGACSATRTGPASSAPSAACSARPASTSPACRSAGTAGAATRSSR